MLVRLDDANVAARRQREGRHFNAILTNNLRLRDPLLRNRCLKPHQQRQRFRIAWPKVQTKATGSCQPNDQAANNNWAEEATTIGTASSLKVGGTSGTDVGASAEGKIRRHRKSTATSRSIRWSSATYCF